MHFEVAEPTILQTDASGFMNSRILNQYNGFGIRRPVICYSQQCSSAEQTYTMYNQELLAIVDTIK